MRLIDGDKLHIELLDLDFPVSDMDPILDAMDSCVITSPPNDPLTLSELREMDGEPVFCVSKDFPEDSAWGIVCMRENVPYVRTIQKTGKVSRYFYIYDYDTRWLAYRRKPEKGVGELKQET